MHFNVPFLYSGNLIRSKSIISSSILGWQGFDIQECTQEQAPVVARVKVNIENENEIEYRFYNGILLRPFESDYRNGIQKVDIKQLQDMWNLQGEETLKNGHPSFNQLVFDHEQLYFKHGILDETKLQNVKWIRNGRKIQTDKLSRFLSCSVIVNNEIYIPTQPPAWNLTPSSRFYDDYENMNGVCAEIYTECDLFDVERYDNLFYCVGNDISEEKWQILEKIAVTNNVNANIIYNSSINVLLPEYLQKYNWRLRLHIAATDLVKSLSVSFAEMEIDEAQSFVDLRKNLEDFKINPQSNPENNPLKSLDFTSLYDDTLKMNKIWCSIRGKVPGGSKNPVVVFNKMFEMYGPDTQKKLQKIPTDTMVINEKDLVALKY